MKEEVINSNKNAFTMIELVFVIVVLGILATIALPKFGSTVESADIAKGKSDISAVRSAISNARQAEIIKGNSSYVSSLDNGAASNQDGETIFDTNGSIKLLTYGVKTKNTNGHWIKTDTNTYSFMVNGIGVSFTYDSATGKFTCDRDNDTSGEYCKKLTD